MDEAKLIKCGQHACHSLAVAKLTYSQDRKADAVFPAKLVITDRFTCEQDRSDLIDWINRHAPEYKLIGMVISYGGFTREVMPRKTDFYTPVSTVDQALREYPKCEGVMTVVAEAEPLTDKQIWALGKAGENAGCDWDDCPDKGVFPQWIRPVKKPVAKLWVCKLHAELLSKWAWDSDVNGKPVKFPPGLAALILDDEQVQEIE